MAYFADLIMKWCGACAYMDIRAFLTRDFKKVTQTFYALKYGPIDVVFESSDIVIMLLLGKESVFQHIQVRCIS